MYLVSADFRPCTSHGLYRNCSTRLLQCKATQALPKEARVLWRRKAAFTSAVGCRLLKLTRALRKSLSFPMETAAGVSPPCHFRPFQSQVSEKRLKLLNSLGQLHSVFCGCEEPTGLHDCRTTVQTFNPYSLCLLICSLASWLCHIPQIIAEKRTIPNADNRATISLQIASQFSIQPREESVRRALLPHLCVQEWEDGGSK